MPANPNDVKRLPETEWHGDFQQFSGPALAPDDPRLEPRVRRGRPVDSAASSASNDHDRDQSNENE